MGKKHLKTCWQNPWSQSIFIFLKVRYWNFCGFETAPNLFSVDCVGISIKTFQTLTSPDNVREVLRCHSSHNNNKRHHPFQFVSISFVKRHWAEMWENIPRLYQTSISPLRVRTSMMVWPRKSSDSRLKCCFTRDLMSSSSSHTRTLIRSVALWHSLQVGRWLWQVKTITTTWTAMQTATAYLVTAHRDGVFSGAEWHTHTLHFLYGVWFLPRFKWEDVCIRVRTWMGISENVIVKRGSLPGRKNWPKMLHDLYIFIFSFSPNAC